MSTAPKLPPDETLVILRRIEPTLEAILAEQKETRADLKRQGESIAELGESLTDLKSRVEVNSRMIASLIAARVAEAIQPR